MSKTTFDLEKIRRKWDLAMEPDVGRSSRVEGVRAPGDPVAAARSELARLRQLTLGSFETRASALGPLFDRAAGLIERLEGADAAELDELRADLHSVLYDLEDLLEVYCFVAP
ncbi:MAG: hypothetical protein WCI05_16680 [Myxococcales bacterium]